MSLEHKIAQAKIELEQKRDRAGKYRKETWREKFGFFRIMWIIIWSASLGASYTFVWLKFPEMFESKPITIINRVNAEENKSEKVGDSIPSEWKSEGEIDIRKAGTFYTYNAEEGQTDSNPYRTASGRIVREGFVANNCLKFGAKIEVEGVGTLEVQDRMNSRYGCDDFDVFKENPKDNFKKQLKYKVL